MGKGKAQEGGKGKFHGRGQGAWEGASLLGEGSFMMGGQGQVSLGGRAPEFDERRGRLNCQEQVARIKVEQERTETRSRFIWSLLGGNSAETTVKYFCSYCMQG